MNDTALDLKPQTHSIEFTCGEKTCCPDESNICPFFNQGIFLCNLFKKSFTPFEVLHTQQGSFTLRLDECLRAYPVDDKPDIPALVAEKSTLRRFLDELPEGEAIERLNLEARIEGIDEILDITKHSIQQPPGLGSANTENP
jgi:hypothetical protein